MFKELFRIYDYREMLKNSVRKELRVRYKGSVLGFLWTFINPLLQLVVYSLVFNKILGVTITKNVPYALWLFVALVPWTCISSTILQSTTLIVGNGNLIKKIYFPRLILPLSMTVTNVVNMLLTEIIVFATVLFFRVPITISYVALPVVFLVVFFLSFAFAVILSAITVYFRDLEHIFGIIVMMWFYLTPIIYETNDRIPEAMQPIYKLNPVYGIVTSIRSIMIDGQFPDTKHLLYTFAFSFVVLIIGLFVFDRCQRRFAEEI